MSEETKPAEPTKAPPPPPAPPAPPAPEAPPPERPAWASALDEAPADELRRHRKIAGIVGDELKHRQDAWEAEKLAQVAEEARKKAEADVEAAENDLDRLFQENPLTFAEKVQNQRQINRTQQRLRALEANARQSVAKSVGAAFHGIPEWQQVLDDPDEYATLLEAIQGKDDDQVIPAWNRAATDAVARIRAKTLAETHLSERLAKEKAAWEEEAAAKGLATSTRPDIRRGSRTTSLDPEPDYRNAAQWNAWYARNTPGAKRR